MAWVMTSVAVVGAASSIHASNVQGAAQRSAMNRQQADTNFSISFNEEVTKLEQAKAQIGFEQQFNQRLSAYNDMRSQQMTVIGYQGRTMDSTEKIRQAEEQQWEYDSKVMEINNNINQKAISISNMQNTLGMTSQVNGLEAAKSASKSAQTWNNLSTLASTAGTVYGINTKYGGNGLGTPTSQEQSSGFIGPQRQ